ncbi:MAG: uroporphyrinogen-III synthase [Gammaproteobacteria bacterium]|nr:uroporphyrinogen-III synthase [Gammaproteobacteria bacterium]NIR97757.1 uroporphyrinogen-III synthase [Gammaproteobacteria bacterium]NIT63467.1 uroporphyrinogen-III synthase [Gammaproteobacteria bacterium]NIV20399.1 uroporphyrinogen-III synthase [Gammaproteobacteria bacterium]NIX10917.1 uroporphyrinogen-III synthase [Gammaproteobacteria bacterium]
MGVLVTRPAHQARRLCELIEDCGGRAVRFPVMEIADPGDPGALEPVLAALDRYDLAVFISANAAARGMPLILSRRPWPRGLAVAAVGRASARELARFGHPATICPRKRFDSEALLAMEELQDMQDRRVVIFRGEGGRELLADTLRARGATVDYAEVYRRVRPEADSGPLLDRWRRGEIDVAVVASGEGLRNLFDLVGEQGRSLLCETPLVVVSERMVQLARELGCRAQVLVAEPGDESIVAALKAWRSAAG